MRVPEGYNDQTGWHGGFDCVLGNPPWEHTEIKEKEWFAERAPEIAEAAGAKRKQLIDKLRETDSYLFDAFAAEKRVADGFSHFVRTSGNYPLTGRGRINTYPLFTEKSRHVLNGNGHIGIIIPSGIATDDTTKFFFQDVMQTGSLVSLYDFENREGIFPAVDSRMKFCLLTMATLTPNPSPSGRGASSALTLNPSPSGRGTSRAGGQDSLLHLGEGPGMRAEFVFFAHSIADLQDDWRRFTLSAQDIAMLNPNTGTMATFRSVKDAEITKAIYRRVPVLIREEPLENPWGITFKQGLFNMTSDSGLFRTREELEAAGYVLRGNHFVHSSTLTLNPSPSGRGTSSAVGQHSLLPEGEGPGMRVYLPLYEAKMMHQFTHRWATYQDDGATRDMTLDELQDPFALVIPRYWVDEIETRRAAMDYRYDWIVAFRNVARSTDEKTGIFGLIPFSAVGNSSPVILVDFDRTNYATGFVSNLSTFVFDFAVRQKVGGINFNFYIVQQLPVIPPHTYTPALLDFIVPRVLELTYTAWDLQPFAQDVGYHGAPFIWDEERRFLMRCELDALYFHLYQIPRDDVDYIMETFPIVKRKDEAAHGEYLTKRIILEMYDQMAALPSMHVPAPKSDPHPPAPSPSGRRGESTVANPPRHEGGGEGLYAVPDVSQWQTWLNPPPADESAAHGDSRGAQP